jgi:hypothetical protein
LPANIRISTGTGFAIMTLLFAGCASLPDTKSIVFIPATSTTYERRDELPAISTATYDKLVAGGSIIVGSATATQVIERCWDELRKCKSVKSSVNVTTALLIEAMDQGADIVVLTADREPSYENIERRGQCLAAERVCVSVPGPTQNERCGQVCATYEKRTGVERIETSAGMFWRSQSQEVTN